MTKKPYHKKAHPWAKHQEERTARIDKVKDILKYADVAELLSIPIGTLYAFVHQNRIPHIKVGPRFIRFSRTQVMSWWKSHYQKSIRWHGGESDGA